jgi:hypothetical protein
MERKRILWGLMVGVPSVVLGFLPFYFPELTSWLLGGLVFLWVASALLWQRLRISELEGTLKAAPQREVLEKELDLYQDIARGNIWNWARTDVGVNDLRYRDWEAWARRCISYAPRIDKRIRETYNRWIGLLQTMGQGQRDEWTRFTREVQAFCDTKIKELQKELDKMK